MGGRTLKMKEVLRKTKYRRCPSFGLSRIHDHSKDLIATCTIFAENERRQLQSADDQSKYSSENVGWERVCATVCCRPTWTSIWSYEYMAIARNRRTRRIYRCNDSVRLVKRENRIENEEATAHPGLCPWIILEWIYSISIYLSQSTSGERHWENHSLAWRTTSRLQPEPSCWRSVV